MFKANSWLSIMEITFIKIFESNNDKLKEIPTSILIKLQLLSDKPDFLFLKLMFEYIISIHSDFVCNMVYWLSRTSPGALGETEKKKTNVHP